jgi:hypothetical protein
MQGREARALRNALVEFIIEASLDDPRQPNFASRIERSLADLQALIGHLQTPIAELHKPIVDLQKPIADLHKPIAELQKPLAELKRQSDSLRASIDQVASSSDASVRKLTQQLAQQFSQDTVLSRLEELARNHRADFESLQKQIRRLYSDLDGVGEFRAGAERMNASIADLAKQVRKLEEHRARDVPSAAVAPPSRPRPVTVENFSRDGDDRATPRQYRRAGWAVAACILAPILVISLAFNVWQGLKLRPARSTSNPGVVQQPPPPSEVPAAEVESPPPVPPEQHDTPGPVSAPTWKALWEKAAQTEVACQKVGDAKASLARCLCPRDPDGCQPLRVTQSDRQAALLLQSLIVAADGNEKVKELDAVPGNGTADGLQRLAARCGQGMSLLPRLSDDLRAANKGLSEARDPRKDAEANKKEADIKAALKKRQAIVAEAIREIANTYGTCGNSLPDTQESK